MLTIIIVSYNSATVVEDCLGRLLTKTAHRVLLVENGADEANLARLAVRFPAIEIMKMHSNLGYGRAANAGLEKVGTPYALLINPDLKMDEAQVDEMLAFAQRQPDDVVITAPAVTQQHFTQKGAVEQDWVVGAAMMFRMSLMSRLGGFDPNIFLFFEETELCARARKAGMHIKMNTDCYVEHQVGRSTPASESVERLKHWHFGWSLMYFESVHGSMVKAVFFDLIPAALKSILYRLSSGKKSKKYYFRFSGMLSFLMNKGSFDGKGLPKCEHIASIKM